MGDGTVRPLRPDPQVLDRLGAFAVLWRQPDNDWEVSVRAGLIEIAGAIAADGDTDGGIDVAGRQAITRGACAIDIDLDGRLAERGEHRQIDDARHGGEHRLDLVRRLGQRGEIVAEQLDRILALHAGHCFGDVVLQILREVEFNAGEFRLQLRQQFGGKRILVLDAGPVFHRLERREELGIKQAGGVGAVVGAALLRHHGLDFRPRPDQAPHLVDVAVAFFQ